MGRKHYAQTLQLYIVNICHRNNIIATSNEVVVVASDSDSGSGSDSSSQIVTSR